MNFINHSITFPEIRKKEMANSKTYCWYPHLPSTKTLQTEFTISCMQLANSPLRHSTHMQDKKSSPT